jgi:hypothetical protein
VLFYFYFIFIGFFALVKLIFVIPHDFFFGNLFVVGAVWFGVNYVRDGARDVSTFHFGDFPINIEAFYIFEH